MFKRVKKIIVMSMVGVMSIGSIAGISASAKSLKASFSGSSSLNCVESNILGNYWTKSSTAKTSGYSGYHYVRAYVGGSSSSAKGAWADTKRKYSYGDISKKCTTDKLFVGHDQNATSSFPRGYAKYGIE